MFSVWNYLLTYSLLGSLAQCPLLYHEQNLLTVKRYCIWNWQYWLSGDKAELLQKPDNFSTLDTPCNNSIWEPWESMVKVIHRKSDDFIVKQQELKALLRVHKSQPALDKTSGYDDQNPHIKPPDCHVTPLPSGRWKYCRRRQIVRLGHFKKKKLKPEKGVKG